jgi:hydroxymethylpyrimidine pyrophosphatase-like HAD family hydrolase
MLFASDLDSTLVYPARTQPSDQATEAAEYRDGQVLTCASSELPAALAELAGAGVTLIPVTARSRSMLDALAPFRGTRIAVTAAGGRIWRDGEPLADWDRELRRLLDGAATCAQARTALAAGFAGESWIIGELVIDDSWVILLAPHDKLPADAEPRARQLLADLGWTAYGHGRKLYCIPAELRKETALRWLVARLGADLVAAAGDSEMDVGLLGLAPVAFCPAGSSLASSSLRPAHTRVTSAPCAAAGPEILRAVAALTSTRSGVVAPAAKGD